MKKITIREIDYFSERDENIFFTWLNEIPAIVKKQGIANNLHLHIDQKKLNETGLRELLALFQRYGIDMKQLKTFLNEDNKGWFFENKEAFWHQRVFVTDKKAFVNKNAL
jgi:hypothetical protein